MRRFSRVMVLFHFPHVIAEYSASRVGRSVSPTMFVFQGCACCPHSTADHLCWGFGLALWSRTCGLPCPPVLLHRRVIGKVPRTLCSLQVLSNAINPPSISQGVASTSNAHCKHHMLQLQVLSPAPPRL